MALKFSDPNVAKKYTPITEVDVKINSAEYTGLLSNAPLNAVEAMLKRKSSLVKEIVQTTAPKAAAAQTGTATPPEEKQ